MLGFIKKTLNLRTRIEQLEKSNLALHQAICSIENSPNFGSALSEVMPVEVLDLQLENTLIVFGGMMSQPSMPPKEFFNSLPKDEFNIIFVKDFLQSWYTKGLLGKSHNFNESVVYLKDRLPISTKRIICMGTSSGGYASIRFGLALGAEKVISFSPQTFMDKSVFKEHGKPQTSRDVLNDSMFDLKQYIIDDAKIIIDIYYGERNFLDKQSALMLKDEANLFPYPTRSHAIAKYLKDNGRLQEVISSLFKQ